MKQIVIGLVMLALAGATPTIAAAKGKTECNGVISNTTFNGGVSVKAGDGCQLINVTVNGDITQTGGDLTVCGSTINGEVNAANSDLTAFGEIDTSPHCAADQIDGKVKISNVADVELDSNTINGAADIEDSGAQKGVEVESNIMHGVLDCEGNTNISNDGHPNTVTGQEKGQCVGF